MDFIFASPFLEFLDSGWALGRVTVWYPVAELILARLLFNYFIYASTVLQPWSLPEQGITRVQVPILRG